LKDSKLDISLWNGDCIELMTNIPDGSIDAIICDPPYNIGKDFGNKSDKQDFIKYLVCDIMNKPEDLYKFKTMHLLSVLNIQFLNALQV
jgi:DNA modification methylase